MCTVLQYTSRPRYLGRLFYRITKPNRRPDSKFDQKVWNQIFEVLLSNWPNNRAWVYLLYVKNLQKDTICWIWTFSNVDLSTCRSIDTSICRHTDLSTRWKMARHQSINMSICWHVDPSTRQSVDTLICRHVDLSTCGSVLTSQTSNCWHLKLLTSQTVIISNC